MRSPLLITFISYTHTLLFLSLLPSLFLPLSSAAESAVASLFESLPLQNRSHSQKLWQTYRFHQKRKLASVVASSSGGSIKRPRVARRRCQKLCPRLPQGSNGSTPTPSPLQSIKDLRIKSIVADLKKEDKKISAWVSSLSPEGKWPENEVDYTTGCAARRANWPAQLHWRRIVTMAAVWHDSPSGMESTQNKELKTAISIAMNYWFGRDFEGTACLDKGGTEDCPCENPNDWLWNTNWFPNVIRIPQLVGQSCLLLGTDNLSESQLTNCVRIASRSYQYPGLTGSNLLDISRIGMDQALLMGDIELLMDAYQKAHSELKIVNSVMSDGICADGTFAQHAGMLYNGNYGKDYVNDILGIEIEASGTVFAADDMEKAAFETLFEGNRWMVILNTITGVLHWDFSVLGRFISFPVADDQATGSLQISLHKVRKLGDKWDSRPLLEFAESLNHLVQHANAGNLVGNRHFYTNDYMVHRGKNYVSTLKMWSKRTRHTECTNSQNPFGFHLSDGVIYTYIRGDEYEDIAAAWDWNLIPGITTDYGVTPLTCGNTKLLGLESFVGGASDERIGVAAMRYTNPATKALRWKKAWFFLEDDVQHVMVANVVSTSEEVPVYSVLDQRRRRGRVVLNGDGVDLKVKKYASALVHSLWHGDVGYVFDEEAGARVTIQVGPESGDWSQIGISQKPPSTVDLFAAWVEHEGLSSDDSQDGNSYSPLEYSVVPGTSYTSFVEKIAQVKKRVKTLKNDGHVSAVFDAEEEVLMAVFWDASGGEISFEAKGCPKVTVAVDGNGVLIYRLKAGELTVADPGQSLEILSVTVTVGEGGAWPKRWKGGFDDGTQKTLVISLPSGGLAGSSVTRKL